MPERDVHYEVSGIQANAGGHATIASATPLWAFMVANACVLGITRIDASVPHRQAQGAGL